MNIQLFSNFTTTPKRSMTQYRYKLTSTWLPVGGQLGGMGRDQVCSQTFKGTLTHLNHAHNEQGYSPHVRVFEAHTHARTVLRST